MKPGKSRTEGNSDRKQPGKTAERKDWGGTVRPLARKGQGEIEVEQMQVCGKRSWHQSFERSFVSPQRACVGKEQRVVPEVWADFAEIGCG